MSGNSNETPRQKMIGMMYLVLTCLLALNVSKEVMKGFLIVNKSIETTNQHFKDNAQKIMKAMESAVSNGHPEVKAYFVRAKDAVRLTGNTFQYVTNLKTEVLNYTEKLPKNDTVRLKFVQKNDDYDAPTYFLLGEDETKPKTGAYSALELKAKLNGMCDSLLALVEVMNKTKGEKFHPHDYSYLKERINFMRPKNPDEMENGVPVTWEIQQFYHLPLAAVVTNLSKIQSDIRNLEGEIISTFADAGGKINVAMNQIAARVVPVSHYVQAGNNYTADVFLSATSTDFKEDNIQYILGEVDTVTGALKDGARILPIDQGTGKVIFPTSSLGHQRFKGVIKLKNAVGEYKYYPFENEYTVAPSAASVSPSKMNVLYVGVDNPLNVTAAGVSTEDLVLKTNSKDAEIVKTGTGEYMIRVKSKGKCEISVFANTPEGLKQQGKAMEFRVKDLPLPTTKIGGYTGNAVIDIPLGEAKALAAVIADASNFEFQSNFKVVSFSMECYINGSMSEERKCAGPRINSAGLADLQRLKKGSRIYFTNVVAEGPGNRRVELNSINFKVK